MANARYVCINKDMAFAPREIAGQSLFLEADIGKVLDELTA